jgi:hypothetical protein
LVLFVFASGSVWSALAGVPDDALGGLLGQKRARSSARASSSLVMEIR